MLPRDVRLLSTAVSKTQPPPKDTGTVLGIVEREPITTYRRELLTNPIYPDLISDTESASIKRL